MRTSLNDRVKQIEKKKENDKIKNISPNDHKCSLQMGSKVMSLLGNAPVNSFR